MVEQWDAHLERDRHRGAIDLGQNVIGKVGHRVEILHALDEIRHQLSDASIVEWALGLSPADNCVLGIGPLGHHLAVEDASLGLAREHSRKLVHLGAKLRWPH